MKITALMPMRHSSERVPGKNYRDFNGRPLFHHVLDTLLKVKRITQVVINTDSPTVIEQCNEFFPEVICVERPESLLGGDTPMTAILAHDAQLYPSDWYLQTHSTNPLLKHQTIDAALDALLKDPLAAEDPHRHDSLFSVTRLQTRLYDRDGKALNHDPKVLLRTQDLPPLFEENSNIYVFRKEHIENGLRMGSSPLMFEMDPLEAVDIDIEEDFVLAETLHRLKGAK